jgi:archaellum biogenesis ATPase FlaH
MTKMIAEECTSNPADAIQQRGGVGVVSEDSKRCSAGGDRPPHIQGDGNNPFRQFSLIGTADELAKQMQEQTPLLGSICLKGQATVIYAKPNTGKTLLVLKLLMEAVEAGRVKGDNVIYFGADDTTGGIVDKVRLLEPHGVHVVVPGHKQFATSNLPAAVKEMIVNDTAKGQVLILDTLKKFVSLMDKRDSTTFTELARQFVMRGGTVIALAHTNKRTGSDGKPIFAGTSDIVDDFDCAHTIIEIGNAATAGERVVQFDCIKRRGDVAQQVAYAYSVQDGQTYSDMLRSVRIVPLADAAEVRRETEVQSDAEFIDTVEGSILAGFNTKTELVKALSGNRRMSNHAADAFIKKYTGEDPAVHRWDFDRGGRGAQFFKVLPRPSVLRPPDPTDDF